MWLKGLDGWYIVKEMTSPKIVTKEITKNLTYDMLNDYMALGCI